MALAKASSKTRDEFGILTGTPLTRGLVLNGFQIELVRVTKLTGDTSGSFDVEDVERPARVFVLIIADSAGAVVADPTLAEVAFTHTDDNTIALSALGDWTAADLLVCGRSRKKY
jgi:hypothetical protein